MGKLENVKEACFSLNAIQIGTPINAVMSEHVHGGVTAGCSNTAAAEAITSPSPIEISNVV